MLNAAMALAAGCELGLSPAAAARGLADFPGMQRRLEFRGTWRGADLFDDYAHHPTAASAVLSTLASCFPGRRIVAVFEPHQCSRLRGLMSEFSEALRLADELYVLPALRIRESASAEESAALSGELVQLIRNLGGRAKLVSDLDRVTGILDDAVRPGDIVITMGAGRTNTIHDQIIRRIQRDSAA
jgi:UDP-N-acetylmuramate--alanine ligase